MYACPLHLDMVCKGHSESNLVCPHACGLLQVVMFEFRAKAYLGRPDEKQYGFVLEAPDGVVSALHTGTNTIAAEVRLRGQGGPVDPSLACTHATAPPVARCMRGHPGLRSHVCTMLRPRCMTGAATFLVRTCDSTCYWSRYPSPPAPCTWHPVPPRRHPSRRTPSSVGPTLSHPLWRASLCAGGHCSWA